MRRRHDRILRGRAWVAPFALLLAAWVNVPARAAERPAITRASVYVSGDVIAGDLDCADLFSEEVVGTVESGLPAVVELLYQIVDRKGKRVRGGLYTLELRYDVWDDIYTLDRGDTVRSFDSFGAMGAAVERLRGVPVAPLADVASDGEYAVEFAIAVHPLRGSEETEMVGWVDEQVAGSASRGWRERLLNVNDLITRFFSHDKDTTSRSEWHRTAYFSPSNLRGTLVTDRAAQLALSAREASMGPSAQALARTIETPERALLISRRTPSTPLACALAGVPR